MLGSAIRSGLHVSRPFETLNRRLVDERETFSLEFPKDSSIPISTGRFCIFINKDLSVLFFSDVRLELKREEDEHVCSVVFRLRFP